MSVWKCGIYPNMLLAALPFQIDGNFSAAVAIAEMLIQSHYGLVCNFRCMESLW
ncbi:glycosyl hydrolase family 95 catalytic domain-containing protein [Pedobacter alluvionis]|uniref:glycosyl hydrolase family 95 catalytic domain-containing protein n=1 Tax=Pedobacter alluvionis TaxID=475253 RepID=UPI003743D7EE